MAEWKPRITAEVTEAQYKRFVHLVPHGLRKRLVAKLLDSALDSIEKHGELAIAAIMEDHISILDLIKAKEAR